MRITLIRHAIAEDLQEGQTDADRALTPKGRQKFSRSIGGIARLGPEFDTLFTSTKRRAIETADVLVPLVRGLRTETVLLEQAPTEDLLLLFRGVDHVACVGHQPHMTQLGAMLAFGPNATGVELELKKGGAIVLVGKPAFGAMTIHGVYTSQDLRRMARAEE